MKGAAILEPDTRDLFMLKLSERNPTVDTNMGMFQVVVQHQISAIECTRACNQATSSLSTKNVFTFL